MQTFVQRPFFGGSSYHLPDIWSDQVKEFVRINNPISYDENVHLTLTWGFSAAAGLIIANQLEYTQPIADPPIFAKLRSLPALVSTFGIRNVTSLSRDLRDQAATGQR